MKNRTKSLSVVMIFLTFGTIMSKILGFFRELVVAYCFGTSEISDAFVLTNSIPTLLFTSIGTAVAINYIPVSLGIGTKEKENSFTSNLINIFSVILLVGSIVTIIFPKAVLFLFATGLSESTVQKAVVMLRIVIFSIFPIILSNIFQAYAQRNSVFYPTAIYGVIINIFTILFTLISTEKTYMLLSVGTVVANTIGCYVMYRAAKSAGFKYSGTFSDKEDNLKKIILLTVPLLIEDISASLSLIVDRNLASYLNEGIMTALSYSGNIANIAGTMITTSIITATFPKFSKYSMESQMEKFKHSFIIYARLISYLLAPIQIFMCFYAVQIVEILFEHGKFDKNSTVIVSQCLISYAVGIMPMGAQSYLVRGFYSLGDTKNPVKYKVFALLCNVIMNLLMVRSLQHVGIALSTSISYIIAFLLLGYFLKKKHEIAIMKIMIIDMLISSGVAMLSIAIVKQISNLVFYNQSLFTFIVVGVVYIVIYLILQFILNNNCREVMRSLKVNN